MSNQTVKAKVGQAFRQLRKVGYIAKQNFWCCQGCAWSAIPEGTTKAVFYHKQDGDSFDYFGEFKNGETLWLAWSGDAKEIVEALESAGLRVEWDGNKDKRIEVLGHAKVSAALPKTLATA